MKDQFHIQWHITNFCNLRCKHCYQEDFSKKYDLEWAGLKRVSDNILATLSEWNRKTCIHLTGGEPLLKEELFSLLNYLDPKPEIEELGIITNGLLFSREVLERLLAFSTPRTSRAFNTTLARKIMPKGIPIPKSVVKP